MVDNSGALKLFYSRKLDTLKLNSDFEVLRRGGELCLVTQDSSPKFDGRPGDSFIEAIVRGHDWYERIVDGRVGTVERLAEWSGLPRTHIRRILRCTSLSPQIVDVLLAGKHRPKLTLKDILHKRPLVWRDQEKRIMR